MHKGVSSTDLVGLQKLWSNHQVVLCTQLFRGVHEFLFVRQENGIAVLIQVLARNVCAVLGKYMRYDARDERVNQ